MFHKDGVVHELAFCSGQELPPDDTDTVGPAKNADQFALGEIAVGGLSGSSCAARFSSVRSPAAGP